MSRTRDCPLNFEMGNSMARTPEGKFQDRLLLDLKALFQGCLVLKNDPNYRQGIPDLLVLYKSRWALLEVKKSENERPRPNQPWYVDYGDKNSFGAFIFPENKHEVLEALSNYFNQ